MNCLRCNSKMNHYNLNTHIEVYGAATQRDYFSAEKQEPHNPQSIFICPNCGYVELSMMECPHPDL